VLEFLADPKGYAALGARVLPGYLTA